MLALFMHIVTPQSQSRSTKLRYSPHAYGTIYYVLSWQTNTLILSYHSTTHTVVFTIKSHIECDKIATASTIFVNTSSLSAVRAYSVYPVVSTSHNDLSCPWYLFVTSPAVLLLDWRIPPDPIHEPFRRKLHANSSSMKTIQLFGIV